MVSLASRAVIANYRLTRRKRVFADMDQLYRSLQGRDPANAAPPRRMFERYRIGCRWATRRVRE